jgi:hypothetical protein
MPHGRNRYDGSIERNMEALFARAFMGSKMRPRGSTETRFRPWP